MVRTKLDDLQLDALFISNHYNIYYLCGLAGLSSEEREYWALLTDAQLHILTDGRYLREVRDMFSSNKSVIVHELTSDNRVAQHILRIAQAQKLKRVGFESENLTYSEYSKIDRNGYKLIPIFNTVAQLRAVKDRAEIRVIKEACKRTDACFEEIVQTIRVGDSESEIAWRIEKWIKSNGDELAFYPIVAVDETAAHPHYNCMGSKTKVKDNSVILIDFGVKHKHYHADMTRMVFMGTPKNTTMDIYNSLHKVQLNAIAMLETAEDYSQVDQATRDDMKKRDLAPHPHSTGHGVGLQIHELPKVARTSTQVPREGNIVTIEPAVYVPGRFGMRIEDTVAITKSGKPEVLTRTKKTPLLLS